MIFSKYYLLRFLLLISFISILIAIPKTVVSQSLYSEIPTYTFRTGAGYSNRSVVLLGKTNNTTTQFYSLGVSKHIRSYSQSNHLYYSIDITPYINYYYPQRDHNDLKTEVNGFGFSPFGLQLRHLYNNRFSFLGGASGGFAIVEHNFPTEKGRKFNFMFDLSASILTEIANHLSIALGYKFHHISNANTGSENPGIDSNFLYFSIHIN